MTPIRIAKAHLAKAQEFLDAAEILLNLDMFNAAISSAALSGISSKDAVCLRLTGRTDKTERHWMPQRSSHKQGMMLKRWRPH